MEKLKPIPYDTTLSHFNLYRNPDADDRLETVLKLCDYSWMEYKLTSFFPTKDYGDLDINFIYSGTTLSEMNIKQTLDNHVYFHHIEFESRLFEKYIVMFMKKHISSWKSKYAFCGEKIVLEFYNEVLKNNVKYKIDEYSEIAPDYIRG